MASKNISSLIAIIPVLHLSSPSVGRFGFAARFLVFVAVLSRRVAMLHVPLPFVDLALRQPSLLLQLGHLGLAPLLAPLVVRLQDLKLFFALSVAHWFPDVDRSLGHPYTLVLLLHL